MPIFDFDLKNWVLYEKFQYSSYRKLAVREYMKPAVSISKKPDLGRKSMTRSEIRNGIGVLGSKPQNPYEVKKDNYFCKV